MNQFYRFTILQGKTKKMASVNNEERKIFLGQVIGERKMSEEAREKTNPEQNAINQTQSR